MTPRGITLGCAAIADAGVAYLFGSWICNLVPAVVEKYAFKPIDVAVVAYFSFIAWFGCARLAIWLWPPPEPPSTSFETIDELAQRRGWKKPRNTRFDDELSREEDE